TASPSPACNWRSGGGTRAWYAPQGRAPLRSHRPSTISRLPALLPAEKDYNRALGAIINRRLLRMHPYFGSGTASHPPNDGRAPNLTPGSAAPQRHETNVAG